MTRHELKTWPKEFSAIINGLKTFEIRENDRDFKAGDELLLLEWEPKSEMYTGRKLLVLVPYISTHCQLAGHVVMSVRIQRWALDGPI